MASTNPNSHHLLLSIAMAPALHAQTLSIGVQSTLPKFQLVSSPTATNKLVVLSNWNFPFPTSHWWSANVSVCANDGSYDGNGKQHGHDSSQRGSGKRIVDRHRERELWNSIGFPRRYECWYFILRINSRNANPEWVS
jgi:hypothetical protein